MPEKPSFSVRDCVRLKSGGPVMRIIASGYGFGAMEGINTYTCSPLNAMGEEEEKIYQESELVLVEDGRG